MGAAIATFGGGVDSVYTLQQLGASLPAPTVLATGGNPGGYLRLTANINDQHSFVPFDLTDAGTFPASTFSFQFRIDNLGAGGADGFSFSYLDTALFGATGALGAAPFTAEDPAATGVLGFGFDTWGNGGGFDANGNSADYSEISLFYNGLLVQRVDDTRLLPVSLNLKDAAWHTVTGQISFTGQTVSLSVDGNPIMTDVMVADLVPFESRILFGGRTGGANERASIDNVNVLYVPEPATGALLVLGGLIALRRRRT